MKRRPLSYKTSRKMFAKGAKVNRKNGLHSVILRGGIRF